MFKEQLYNESDPKYRHLIGKKVSVKHEGREIVGTLVFVGVNEHINQYQVTLNRTPLYPVDPRTLKLVK